MKKLMLTTAIASVLTTAAIAQTTISGELRINYKMIGLDRGIGAAGSPATQNAAAGSIPAVGNGDGMQGFGTEQQINIQTKGKLNVGGLDYAAGMSLENDGEQTTTLFNENVYIDLTNASSGTTISFSRDHIQRSDSDRSATNLVGFTPNEMSQATAGVQTIFQQNIGAAPSQNMGIAIVQSFPMATLSYNYVPNNAAPGASEDVVNDTKSAYEYGITGNLGVKGLSIHYFKNEENKAVTTTVVKAEGTNYGVSYNFGQFTAGANKKVYNPAATRAADNTGVVETTEKAYAIAYAVNKDLSIGILSATGELSGVGKNAASVNKQKIKAINVGYALGPVDLAVGYAQNSDVLGVAGNDSDVFMARLIGKF
jgi:hypothetical protein